MFKFKLFVISFFINFNCFSQTLADYVKSASHNESIGKIELSIEGWDNAIEIDSTDCGWLYWRRGTVKFRIKDKIGQIEDYLFAIDRDLDCDSFIDENFDYGWGRGINVSPTNKRDLLFIVAKLQTEIEDYSNAMINFTKVINAKVGNVDLGMVYFERGKLKNILLDHKSAISDFNLAIKFKPGLQLYSFRGNSKFNIGDYIGAISDYSKIIQKNPNDSPNEFYNRGMARIYLNQIELGCKDLSKSGEQGNLDAYEVIKKYCQ